MDRSEGVEGGENFDFLVIDSGFPAGVEGVGEDEVAVGGSVDLDFYQIWLIINNFGRND